ncbi:NADPH-dependent FMN reductase [Polluticaenibacter yanchengensis]|uniref:NAD(P)H-dependent oxidoreductase n=1 Tax=Polluticaenibacter yanchengensis TaxID=3014562 RepID=A0ABT4UJP4_9BACT|nr:NAD(P)H-dependent oxidoreductase [Chitinophagaceae bacterium LY-5]
MILIIATTNRKQSKTYNLALYYQDLLVELGVESDILTLENLPVDFAFSALYENNGKNEAFNVLREKFEQASKYVYIIPEYNGSFPGVLKTFIDGLGWPSPLKNKKAALVGISDGSLGGAHALSHFTDILHYLHCNVLSLQVRIPYMKKNYIEHQIQDEFIDKLMHEQAEALIDF